jgi:hypothetical protein
MADDVLLSRARLPTPRIRLAGLPGGMFSSLP